MASLSYCAGLTRDFDYPLYLCTLLSQPAWRDAWFAVSAFHAEIAHIHLHMGEEMVGFVRFAWWRETVEGWVAGKKLAGHPLSEAMQPVIAAQGLTADDFLAIVHAYEEAVAERTPVGDAAFIAAFNLYSAVAGQQADEALARGWASLHRHGNDAAALAMELDAIMPMLGAVPSAFRPHAKALRHAARRARKGIMPAQLNPARLLLALWL